MRQNTVNPALTANRSERPTVENHTYAGFVRRVVAAQGRRVAAGDVDGLADLLTLAQEVEAAIDAAVAGLRRAGYSWAEIAARVGVTRQAAHQRWGGEQ
jgi:hypothetical protein